MKPKKAFCCHKYLSAYKKKNAKPLKEISTSDPNVIKIVCSYCGKDPELYLI